MTLAEALVGGLLAGKAIRNPSYPEKSSFKLSDSNSKIIWDMNGKTVISENVSFDSDCFKRTDWEII